MTTAGSAAPRSRVRECAWMLGLGLAAVIYLAALPRDLNESDEGLFLYEAKRVLAGDVFYRDVFDIITPGSQYLMAAVFGLFGTTMLTARIATAVLHAGILACTFVTARHLGVGRSLAALAGIAHVALCQPAWACASPHWVSTGLTMALVHLRVAHPGRLLLAGLVAGAMIMVEQHRGAVMALGMGAALAAGYVAERRVHAQVRPSTLLAQMGRFALGVAAVVVPGLLALTLAAGVQPVVQALVLQPLQSYSAHHGTFAGVRWGFVSPVSGEHATLTFPGLLRWLPVVLVGDVVRLASAWRARDASRLLPRVSLLVLAVFTALSIFNFPDFIHVAAVGALFFLLLADHGAWLLRRLYASLPVRHAVEGVVALVLATALGAQLVQRYRLAYALFPVAHETAFGRVDFRTPGRAEGVDVVRAALDSDPRRELFAYGAYPALYLMADGWNPTPYQLLLQHYSPAWQFERTIAILQARRTPVVAVIPFALRPDDPVIAYLTPRYRIVNDVRRAALAVMVRRPEPSRP